jgi:hypothetical protein
MKNLIKKINYPTVIIENFFENPDKVVDYSKKLKFINHKDWHTKVNWIGSRSESLHITNKPLFNFIIEKFLSIYYGNNLSNLQYYNSYIYFHKITLQDYKNCSLKNTIHKDISTLAAIIYLNKNLHNEETGTSIFNSDKNRLIKISNSYNVLVGYDAKKLHSPTNIQDENRLTLNVFIGKIKRI